MWAPIIILSILWTILFVVFFYIRNNMKKEETEVFEKKYPVKVSAEEKEKFLSEIDELAVYVSRLPRPKDVIQKYRNEEIDTNEN
ncbi:MAG: hypothetical protein AABZ74_02460 [Cyanobacteriota bacterium]